MKILMLFGFSCLLLGCGALPGANPTAVIIVVTATPEGTRAPVVTFFTPTPPATRVSRTPAVAGTADPNATPAPINTAAFDIQPTDVQYVLAKEDINIRNGPGTDFDIVGGVFAGNTAQVTGYKSADDKWWRVVCPVADVTDCWVSADPALTEPTTGPTATPTSTPG
ncbi:MAG: SH3 domain-containing protein [Anaerolineae bacterium]|nr:SH3 domain-containing protein [Anaerolineae bacterium]